MHHVAFFNIRSQWKGTKTWIFCYKSILRNIRSHAETLVPKFRPDLSARLKDIAKKTGPHEAEIDSTPFIRNLKCLYIAGWFRNTHFLNAKRHPLTSDRQNALLSSASTMVRQFASRRYSIVHPEHQKSTEFTGTGLAYSLNSDMLRGMRQRASGIVRFRFI